MLLGATVVVLAVAIAGLIVAYWGRRTQPGRFERIPTRIVRTMAQSELQLGPSRQYLTRLWIALEHRDFEAAARPGGPIRKVSFTPSGRVEYNAFAHVFGAWARSNQVQLLRIATSRTGVVAYVRTGDAERVTEYLKSVPDPWQNPFE
jgi:hypothetical protein